MSLEALRSAGGRSYQRALNQHPLDHGRLEHLPRLSH